LDWTQPCSTLMTTGSDVQRSGDTRGDFLIICHPTKI